jgi:hypothetical protein
MRKVVHAQTSAAPLLIGGRTRDVEPLVDAGVDGRRRLVLALGNVELAGVGALGRVGHGGVDPG